MSRETPSKKNANLAGVGTFELVPIPAMLFTAHNIGGNLSSMIIQHLGPLLDFGKTSRILRETP